MKPGRAFIALIAAATAICASPSDAAAPGTRTPLDALAWRSIGPFRGGRATAVAGSPADPFTFYMGTAGGGIWKTADAGTRWFNISDGFVATASVGALAVAPSNPDIVYAGMGEDTARANTLHSGDGVYKSTDGGKSWTHLELDDTQVISRILVDPANPNIVYVAAQGPLYEPSDARGVYRSTDGGTTWAKSFFVGKTAGVADLSMDPSAPGVLYAAVWDSIRHPWSLRQFGPASGIYKSSDGGDHWSRASQGLPGKIGKIGVAASSHHHRVYAIVQADPNSQSGLYRSDDSGLHWKLVNSDPRLTLRAFYYTKIFADPTNPDGLWIPNLSLYRTSDGGKTFKPVPDTTHGDHHELWINPQMPRIVAEANDGGASISLDDGQSWSTVDNQPTGQFYRLSTDNGFAYRIYSAQQDNSTVAILSRSTGPGIGVHDWNSVGGAESSFIALDPAHPDLVYSTDPLNVLDVYSGTTDSENARPVYGAFAWGTQYDEFTRYRYSLNTPLLVSPHDPGTLYLGAQKLLSSSDRGKSWREVSPDLTHAGLDPAWDRHAGTGLVGDSNYDVLTYVAESPLAAGELWTGSSDGVVSVSRDRGGHWSSVPLPPPASDARVNLVEPSPFSPAVAYVAATRFQFGDATAYLFRTGDYGRSWTRIDSGLPSGFYARVIRADPVRQGLLYAGTERGAYVSFDDGRRWQPLGRGLPVTPVTDLKVENSDLVASTSGRGIWILDDLAPLRQMGKGLGQSGVVLFRPATAYRTAFGRNADYGGPSSLGRNPPQGAIIDFYTSGKEPVTLAVRDSAGRLVRRLWPDGDSPAADRAGPGEGLHRIVWDLRRAAVASMPPQIHIDGLVPRPRGALVDPGEYRVELVAEGKVRSAPLLVRSDPRWNRTVSDYAEQDKLLSAIDSDLIATRLTSIRFYSAHEQLARVLAATDDPSLRSDGSALLARLSDDRGALLFSHFAYLASWVNSPEPDVVDSERAMFRVLHAGVLAWRSGAETLLGDRLKAFNARAAKAGLPPVVPASELAHPPGAAAEPLQQMDDDDDL
jgi:photosystem II stability/assembly factor-like uncharacterized protein